MPKKQVAVSLRKPPSPESLDAFVNGGAETPSPPVSEEARAAATKRSRTRTPRPKSVEPVAADQAAVMEEAPTPKPSSVRTIPPESTVVAAKERDNAPTEPIAPPAMDMTPTPPIFGVTGVALRPVTVYLPQALAEKLTLHCIQHDRDANNVISEALEGHLSPRLGAGTPPPAAPRPAEEPRPAGAPSWSEPPFGRADWPTNRIERIVEIGRLLIGLVRRRGYAG
ncbi:hypothetical protein [Polyangium aurulentum]|uniref:hypothetical protein n=1 Tax=Polyangium aurulentum TaxID=2567896 RepID=UPI0010ADCEE1|nr:hypothetical protein [Polyangium aurulentum]UQA62690.1 hypothetical protein E8A73_020435 [Polyangium aurulentum]